MSPDHPEPAPPLEPEDLAFESSLHQTLRPRPLCGALLSQCLDRLEDAASGHPAIIDPDSPPMPLDSSLLAIENELRSLRPLDLDFPTGQQILKALEHALPQPTPPPPQPFEVLSAPPTATATAKTRKHWPAALPWAAAAALVLGGWAALPLLSPSPDPAAAEATRPGFIPYAQLTGKKGSVSPIFPAPRAPQTFSARGVQLVSTDVVSPLNLPDTPSSYGFLDVHAFDLPEDYCRKLGIQHGVGIRSVGPGGPASTHGLESGDIVLRINGAPVSTSEDFAVMVKNSAPGSVMTLKVLRGRLLGEIPIRLGSIGIRGMSL